MTFGERVATLRRERGWTQQALAGKIGIDQPFMSKTEADKFDPGMKLVKSIAEAFGMTVSDLTKGVMSHQHGIHLSKALLEHRANEER